MSRAFIISLLIGASIVPAFSQTFLVLEKMGTKKRFEYNIGDRMQIMLNTDDYFTKIRLVGLGDSAIFTENLQIDFSTITAVKLNKNSNFFKVSGPVLMFAGVVLFAIDLINQAVVQGGGYQFSSGVAVASVTMVGVGAVFTFAGKDKVKLKNWWRLRTVQI
jgi:hypothetical protein